MDGAGQNRGRRRRELQQLHAEQVAATARTTVTAADVGVLCQDQNGTLYRHWPHTSQLAQLPASVSGTFHHTVDGESKQAVISLSAIDRRQFLFDAAVAEAVQKTCKQGIDVLLAAAAAAGHVPDCWPPPVNIQATGRVGSSGSSIAATAAAGMLWSNPCSNTRERARTTMSSSPADKDGSNSSLPSTHQSRARVQLQQQQ